MLKNEKNNILLIWTSEIIQFIRYEMHMDEPEVQVNDFLFHFFSFKTSSKSPVKWNCHLLGILLFIFSLG